MILIFKETFGLPRYFCFIQILPSDLDGDRTRLDLFLGSEDGDDGR